MKLAKIVKMVRLLLMASGTVAVGAGAAQTDMGSELSQDAFDTGKHWVAWALNLDEPHVDAGRELDTLLDYRPAWYRWQASEYRQGDQVSDVGAFNMVVQTDSGLALTSSAADPADTHFDFGALSEASVTVRLDFPSWTGQRISLLAGRTELVALEFDGRYLAFGDHREHYRAAGCTGADEIQLTLSDGKARLWCNGRFVGVQIVRRLPLNRVRVSGLVRKRDHLYSVVTRAGVE